MVLKNATIITEDFKKDNLDIRIENKKITEIGKDLKDTQELDLSGKFILPGFVDTHIHGAYGTRISNLDTDLNRFTTFEATQGVTSVAITTASSDFESLMAQLKLAKEASKYCNGAKIAGVHAEGPFIGKKYKGAMKEENLIDPDVKKLDSMLDSVGDFLKIMTVAPELDGCIDFIKYAVSRGVVISMGHTEADYETARRAIDAGATQLTHTFNAMRPLNHREPGVLGACLTDNSVVCEAICDYVHLHPATVKMIYDIKGKDRVNMISDSGYAAGIVVSEFEVDGVKRYVKDGVVRLADGTIAGSTRTLLDGVRNLILSGIPIEDVAKMASYNPARSLKLSEKIGSISVGKYADLAVLDNSYNLDCTYVNGECVYKAVK